MISEMSFSPNEENSLFTQPEQVEQLREQLILLERHHSLTLPPLALLQQPLAALFDPQFDASIRQNAPQQLIARLQECEEQHAELKSYLASLGQLSSQMIDFIQEVQQRHHEQSQAYQHQIECLHEQVDTLTHKNQTIEGDVEAFREQLMAAQSELIEIEREIGGEEEREEEQFQKERQIQVLERQLEKISEQLQFYKFKSGRTESVATLQRRSLMSNCSERAISYWRRPSNSASTLPLQEQVETLKEQVVGLEQDNQKLKLQLKELYAAKAVRDEDMQGLTLDDCRQDVVKKGGFGETQFYTREFDHRESSDRITLTESNSVALMHQPFRFAEIAPHSPQQLAMFQSAQKFHTLSNEWSLKTLQASLTHFKFSNRPDTLIYLNQDEDKQNNRIPQTGETENSVPDSERVGNPWHKMKSTIGVNTEEQLSEKVETGQQTEESYHGLEQDFSLFRSVASGFVNLRTLAVRGRLDKGHFRPNK